MKKFKLNKGFIIQKLGSSLNIFDSEKSILYSFNSTAAFIFQKFKTGWDKKKIIKSMTGKFKVTENTANNDFDEFLHELIDKKIILKSE